MELSIQLQRRLTIGQHVTPQTRTTSCPRRNVNCSKQRFDLRKRGPRSSQPRSISKLPAHASSRSQNRKAGAAASAGPSIRFNFRRLASRSRRTRRDRHGARRFLIRASAEREIDDDLLGLGPENGIRVARATTNRDEANWSWREKKGAAATRRFR